MPSVIGRGSSSGNRPNNRQEVVCSICGTPRTQENRTKFFRGEDDQPICLSCIENPTNNLGRCAVEGCGRIIRIDDAHLSGLGWICEDHQRENYAVCGCCGSRLPRSLMSGSIGSGRQPICISCFDQKYFRCADCGETYKISDLQEVETSDSPGRPRKVCKKCAKRYVRCEVCGRISHEQYQLRFDYRDAEGNHKEFCGCRSCVEQKFNRCSGCGSFFPKDSSTKFFDSGRWNGDGPSGGDRDQVCEKCFYTNFVIRSYNWKPKVHMFRKSDADDTPILFGFENEIELDRNRSGSMRREEDSRRIRLSDGRDLSISYRMWIAHEIDQLMPELIYMKNDGSLSYGIELVSHPATWNFWRDQLEPLEKLFGWLRGERCQGLEAPTAGMHVHISRGQMKLEHQNSLSAFVHGNHEFIGRIARRKSNHYSKLQHVDRQMKDDSVSRYLVNNGDRYQAVNWQNKNTLEIRIFQSNLNTEEFLSNIEFCRALYMFTQERNTASCLADGAVQDFCGWVFDRKDFTFLPRTLERIAEEMNPTLVKTARTADSNSQGIQMVINGAEVEGVDPRCV